jgi:hypothetical protein
VTRQGNYYDRGVAPTSPTQTPRTGRVTSRRADPAVWAAAVLLAAGDHRRLDVQLDGSVIVHNQPVR